jgi:hypothetical protein
MKVGITKQERSRRRRRRRRRRRGKEVLIMRVIQGLEIMDALLVPAGLLLLIVYHCMLAYRVHTYPASTVVGINQINRQLWLRTMMQVS